MKTTPNTIHFSNLEARRFLLHHHFLLPPKTLSGKKGALQIIQRFGCIQFDTINVVGRNADLVFQSRLNNYKSNILDELLYKDRKLIDGWDKVASIYMTEDWPFFARYRKRLYKYYQDRAEEPQKMAPKILNYIKNNGPASSLDFKSEAKTDWAWGPTSIPRAALELLYAQGSLGIHHRINTRRYFDLTENLVPESLVNQADPNKNLDDYLEWHILRRVGGLGIASIKSGEHWLGIHKGRKVSERNAVIPKLVEKQLLLPLKIENLEEQTFYIRTEDYRNHNGWKNPNRDHQISFIAPLDNLIWNRKLIQDIFNFEYTWEVYKPQNKRVYGYYVLPVLYGDRFIARADLKYDKKTGTLNLNGWWWEGSIKSNNKMIGAIKTAFEKFQTYLGATSFKTNNKISLS